MQYKIRCNPMHPLCGALPVPNVAVRVTRGALVALRYLAGNMFFYWPRLLASLFSTNFPLCSFFIWVCIVGLGLWTDRVTITLSQPWITDVFKVKQYPGWSIPKNDIRITWILYMHISLSFWFVTVHVVRVKRAVTHLNNYDRKKCFLQMAIYEQLSQEPARTVLFYSNRL